MRELLTCPTQIDPGVNPSGECDLLKVVLDGETFYLKVDCYARNWEPSEVSEDPANDEKTTRVYTCMLGTLRNGPNGKPATP